MYDMSLMLNTDKCMLILNCFIRDFMLSAFTYILIYENLD